MKKYLLGLIVMATAASCYGYVYTFKNKTGDTVDFKIPLAQGCLQKNIKGHVAPHTTVKLQPSGANKLCCLDKKIITDFKANGKKANVLIKFSKLWGDLQKAEIGLWVGAPIVPVTILAAVGVTIAETCRDISFTLTKENIVRNEKVRNQTVEVVYDYKLFVD